MLVISNLLGKILQSIVKVQHSSNASRSTVITSIFFFLRLRMRYRSITCPIAPRSMVISDTQHRCPLQHWVSQCFSQLRVVEKVYNCKFLWNICYLTKNKDKNAILAIMQHSQSAKLQNTSKRFNQISDPEFFEWLHYKIVNREVGKGQLSPKFRNPAGTKYITKIPIEIEILFVFLLVYVVFPTEHLHLQLVYSSKFYGFFWHIFCRNKLQGKYMKPFFECWLN